MGAWRGITHCYRCGTALADDEFHTCKNCERIEKEKLEKEMMRDLGSLCDDYNERFNEEVENELNKKDTRKMEKAFKKAGISIDNKELEDLMRRIIQEELDKREKEDDKKDYEILRIGRLSLRYKTFIDRTGKDDEIEICMWNSEFTNSWTIASFEYDEEYNYYKLESCGDRLNDSDINWVDFGKLVKEGYKYLDKFID